jgi:hypothetical protein
LLQILSHIIPTPKPNFSQGLALWFSVIHEDSQICLNNLYKLHYLKNMQCLECNFTVLECLFQHLKVPLMGLEWWSQFSMVSPKI